MSERTPPPLAPRIGQTQGRNIKFSHRFIREVQLSMEDHDGWDARSSIATNVNLDDLTEISNFQESDLMLEPAQER
jgi:hypothetical protein